ncbi:MAG: DnaJ domain-containing protein [Cyanobacteria bacterium J06623_4]
MKLAHHYRTLGLRRSASFSDVKMAYRQLVRQYHPDLNPDKQAIEQFIQINHAYTALTEALKFTPEAPDDLRKAEDDPAADFSNETLHTEQTDKQSTGRLNLKELMLKLEKMGLGNFHPSATSAKSDETGEAASAPYQPEPGQVDTANTETSEAAVNSPISEQEAGLKQDAYLQLKELLQQRKFPRAIALVEGLAHRLPADLEIIQWQAIVYQRWGRQLIGEKQLKKAHLYLQKALQTDPNNPSLCEEVNQDLGLLELLSQHTPSS